jgi:hypothetical protein
VTTHSHLLSQGELKCVEEAIDVGVAPFFLSEFDTELDFINKVGYGIHHVFYMHHIHQHTYSVLRVQMRSAA